MKKSEGIQASIEKHEGIKIHLLQKKIMNYREFWSSCGYCEAFLSCNDCPLSSSEAGLPYCCNSIRTPSVVGYMIQNAQDKGFLEALRLCCILLDKMEKDLMEHKRLEELNERN